jgi:glutathione peroxidase
MRPIILFVSLACVFAVAASNLSAQEKHPAGAHEFSFPAIDGRTLALEAYRGKVLLIVNTASQCGYTPQYAGLQNLWQTYQDRGLVVIGVPSNDFGGQEPENEGKILKFCQGTYGVTFPLAAKQRVSGAGAHPFYQWAAEQLGSKSAPRWNFHKYLVSADGRVVAWFSTPTKPMSADITKAVEAELAAANASPIPADTAGGS